ncbi:MAG: adenylate kinase [Oscillospiraceae bacterium]|nr:adenylate kinase [Oscillospiraceae bacterium]
MVIIISGASHTGKTLLAQRLMEELHMPYLSIDHLKMGLIRSGNTDLTPEDDEGLTAYLWPIVREMIKTVIENEQSLIVEGCYIPFDWRGELGESYLKEIRFLCLALSDEYINKNYEKILEHASDIEERMDDSYLSTEFLKEENRKMVEGFQRTGEYVLEIHEGYEKEVNAFLEEWKKKL